MGSLWYLIPLLIVLVAARLWLRPAKPRTRPAEPARSSPDAAQEVAGRAFRAFRATMDTVALWTFSVSLIFSLGFTLFLLGSQGEDVETGILLTAFAYCLSLITLRDLKAPKIVPGGWGSNARDELRYLGLAYVLLVLPLACIGGIKLTMHSDSVNLRAIAMDLAIIFVAFGAAWLIRFLPLPGESLTVGDSDHRDEIAKSGVPQNRSSD